MLTVQRDQHEHGSGCGHGGEQFADPEGAQKAVSSVLQSSGQSLPADVASSLGNVFQSDLSAVREHRGPLAQRATELVNAEAFTVGQHIVYGKKETREMRGHEITHTVAPESEARTDLGGGIGVTSPDQRGEQLAAENGRRVAAGGTSLVTGNVQRLEDDAR